MNNTEKRIREDIEKENSKKTIAKGILIVGIGIFIVNLIGFILSMIGMFYLELGQLFYFATFIVGWMLMIGSLISMFLLLIAAYLFSIDSQLEEMNK